MALNGLLYPGKVEQSITSGQLVGGMIYDDDWDKNKQGLYETGAAAGTAINSWSEEISKLAGTRNPMYMIGDVPSSETSDKISKYVPDQVKGLVRAISNLALGTKQDGVIIDGIGDVAADISVDMPKNPILYRSSYITDQRVRTPNTVKMRVMVSNYLQDSIIDSAVDSITNIDPTGLLKNLLSDGGNTRGQQALYKLRNLQETGIPFTLYTPHGIYENMLIRSIRPRTDDKNMDMLDAEVEFVELLMYAPMGSARNTLARKNIQEASNLFGEIKSWWS